MILARRKQLPIVVALLILALFLIPSVSSLVYQQNTCVDIKQISNSSELNITISYPNSSTVVSNKLMSELTPYNFNYTFCNTDTNGQYNYGYFDNQGNVYSNSFTITPTGNTFTTALSIPIFIPLILILLVALFFFFLTHYVEKIEYKFTFLILGGLFLIFSMAYGIIASLETLWEFPLLYNFIKFS
jgi:hypothetical protein